MDGFRSYVIRVYREDTDTVTGVVESVESGTATPFRTAAELWATICERPAVRHPPQAGTPD